VSLYKGHAITQILIIYIVSFVAPEGAGASTADRHGMKQIILKFVPLCPCTKDTQWHKLNNVNCAFRCPWRGGGRHCRQASQDTNYIKIRAIACPCTGTRNDKNLKSILCVFRCSWKGRRQALPTGIARQKLCWNLCQCMSLYKRNAMTQILIIYIVFRCPWRGGGRNCRQAAQYTNYISMCQGSQRQLCKGHAMTQIFKAYFVSRCPEWGRGRHCGQSAQYIKYINKCVSACPLYSQDSQEQLCKGHAMTRILIIYFVSFVAPAVAEASTAEKQRKTQTTLRFVSLRARCTVLRGTRNDTNLNNMLCVFRCPRRAEERHCRQAAQHTNYIEICNSACRRTRDTQWHKS